MWFCIFIFKQSALELKQSILRLFFYALWFVSKPQYCTTTRIGRCELFSEMLQYNASFFLHFLKLLKLFREPYFFILLLILLVTGTHTNFISNVFHECVKKSYSNNNIKLTVHRFFKYGFFLWSWLQIKIIII